MTGAERAFIIATSLASGCLTVSSAAHLLLGSRSTDLTVYRASACASEVEWHITRNPIWAEGAESEEGTVALPDLPAGCASWDLVFAGGPFGIFVHDNERNGCDASRTGAVQAACSLALSWSPHGSGGSLRARLPEGEEYILARISRELAILKPYRWFSFVVAPVIDVLVVPYWIAMMACSSAGMCSPKGSLAAANTGPLRGSTNPDLPAAHCPP